MIKETDLKKIDMQESDVTAILIEHLIAAGKATKNDLVLVQYKVKKMSYRDPCDREGVEYHGFVGCVVTITKREVV